ncbi:MAG: ADP-ribose pyrophosphatase [uncultured Rubrobacteraceae bacterium]|uniref:ADP-ribose pyrophosphatase n=1 Tax=uncultured Rubrobacteraceae bacterium TaxID=349277 RepID=A0A6J4P497_9ACTN|nr:MAG: ADP-ribose pyrophosphatase [uncultured Rubrobacteraceae bacterium]
MEDASWRTLGREYVYRSPWCSFRVDGVELPDGRSIDYGVLESGGFAAVVALTEGDHVVLVRQWRQPLGAFTLELPSGGIEAGEDAAEAARRELLEEAGYRAEGLERLTSVHTSTGRSTEVGHVFGCRAERDGRGQRPEPTEFIRVVEVPFGESLGMVRDGRISDAATVLGLLWEAGRGAWNGGWVD